MLWSKTSITLPFLLPAALCVREGEKGKKADLYFMYHCVCNMDKETILEGYGNYHLNWRVGVVYRFQFAMSTVCIESRSYRYSFSLSLISATVVLRQIRTWEKSVGSEEGSLVHLDTSDACPPNILFSRTVIFPLSNEVLASCPSCFSVDIGRMGGLVKYMN